MKKGVSCIFLFLLFLSLSHPFACAAAQESSDALERDMGYVVLITDLLNAYENPGEASFRAIDEDVAAIGTPLAAAVAERWKAVYLDPEYRLFLYGTDAPETIMTEEEPSGGHAFVVLGYELAGGEMTDELKGRCDAAAAAADAFPDSVIVCSGGATGKDNPEGHTEAGLMKEYLMSCGVAEERIFTDEQATSTVQNALNTFSILKTLDIHVITIITSSYHQKWGQVLYYAEGARERYPVTIAGNYCYETEPPTELFLHDAQIAAYQLGQILRLGQEAMELLPNIRRR